MNQYLTGVDNDMLGKTVNANLYQHVSLTLQIPQYHEHLSQAARLAGLTPDADFNVVKFNEDGLTVSLLDYPDFFDAAFPAALRAWTADLQTGGIRFRSYEESLNPPILHSYFFPRTTPAETNSRR